MKIGSNLAVVTGGDAWHAWRLSVRVEKARQTSDSYDGATQRSHREQRTDASYRQHAVSHSDTGDNASLWNGPRLRPAFVAQVLGQKLYPQPFDSRSVLAAYEGGIGHSVAHAALDSSV